MTDEEATTWPTSPELVEAMRQLFEASFQREQKLRSDRIKAGMRAAKARREAAEGATPS